MTSHGRVVAFIDLIPNIEPGTAVPPADTLFIEPTFSLAANATPSNAVVHYELDYEQGGVRPTASSPYFWPQVTVP